VTGLIQIQQPLLLHLLLFEFPFLLRQQCGALTGLALLLLSTVRILLEHELRLCEHLAGLFPDQISERLAADGMGGTHAPLFPPMAILARAPIVEPFVLRVGRRLPREGIPTLLTAD
jgi:hypothetical protein